MKKPPTTTITTIGRAEYIRVIDFSGQQIPAKIDTGADLSSIWASDVVEQDGRLSFQLFAEGSPLYTGQALVLEAADYRLTRIANSFGHKELRYAVKLRIEVLGRTIKTTFTLADRNQKTYPVLLGRRLLKNKFVVDVSKGEPLHEQEKAKRRALRIALKEGRR